MSVEQPLVAATGALLRTCRSVDHEGEVSGWALIAPRGGHWSKLRHWPGESTERWAVRCEKAPVCIYTVVFGRSSASTQTLSTVAARDGRLARLSHTSWALLRLCSVLA